MKIPRKLCADIFCDAMIAMLSLSDEMSALQQEQAGSERQDRKNPTLRLESFDTMPWASADQQGTRSVFTISVSGDEHQVDIMAAVMEENLVSGDFDLGEALVADVSRANTDKTVDGRGNAVSVLAFEALTISE